MEPKLFPLNFQDLDRRQPKKKSRYGGGWGIIQLSLTKLLTWFLEVTANMSDMFLRMYFLSVHTFGVYTLHPHVVILWHLRLQFFFFAVADKLSELARALIRRFIWEYTPQDLKQQKNALHDNAANNQSRPPNFRESAMQSVWLCN